MEEIVNEPNILRSKNPWELVVSLVNLDRPMGPTVAKVDKDGISPDNMQGGFPSSPTKILLSNTAKRQEKSASPKLAAIQDKKSVTGPKDAPVLHSVKHTDLSRMKEVTYKL
jgi:hypothetical protein